MKRLVMFSVVTVLASAGWAQIKTAGDLLVNVSASWASGFGLGGNVQSIQNSGTLGGFFSAPLGAGPQYQVVEGAPALYFDASGGAVLAGVATPPELTGGNSWSIETWIYKLPFRGPEELYLAWTLREGVQPPHDRMLEARYYNNTSIAIEHYGGGNLGWGPSVPPIEQWHHVAITRDGVSGMEQVFVDGKLTLSAIRTSVDIAPGGEITLGATWNNSKTSFWGGFLGYLGQVRIHSGTLSSTDVVLNYLSERSVYGVSSDPDYYWTAVLGPWGTAGNWLPAQVPPTAGAVVSILNGGTVELTTDVGVLDQFNPYSGQLLMSGAARLSLAFDSRVSVGYGLGHHFDFDLSEGHFLLPSAKSSDNDGWLFFGVDGGSAAVRVGDGAGPAVISAARDIQVGLGGYATMDIGAYGGVYSSNGWIYVGVNYGGTGIVTVANGGEIGCSNPAGGMNIMLGNNRGYGELTVADGGTVKTRGEVIFTPGNSDDAFACLWLEAGGRVEASRICGQGSGNAPRLLYLNGGTIANQWWHDWFMTDLDVFLQAGGVTFEIKADSRAWVRTPLLTDPALGGTPDGGLVKTGPGVLVLAGENAFEGPIDVQEGQLWLYGANALPDTYTDPIRLNGGSVGWDRTGGAEWLLTNLDPQTATGELVLFESNAEETIDLSLFPHLTLSTSGNFEFRGTYIPYGGVYRFAPQDGRLLFPDAIAGTSSVIVDGIRNGGVELTGANTYSGATTISNGWLMMSSDTALGNGAGAITLLNGSALRLNAGGIPPALTGRITGGSEGFLILGGAYANFPVDLTGKPGVHVGTDQGTLNYGSTITPAGSTYRTGGGGVGYWATPNQGLVLSNLQDNGPTPRDVVIQGAGMVRLAAGNAYSGGTTITNRGVLFLLEDSGLGAVPPAPDPSNVSIDNGVVRNGERWFETHENRGWNIGPGGAEFHPWGGNQLTIKGNLSGTGPISTTDGGSLVFGGTGNTWTGSLDIRGNAYVQLGRESDLSWMRDNPIIGNGGWFALFGDLSTGTRTWSDIFAKPLGADGANMGFRKRGEGSLLVDVDPMYTWDTIIEAGTLIIGSPGAIPSGANTQISGTLDLNGYAIAIGAIYGNGTILDAPGGAQRINVGANNASATFYGSVAPDITLTKVGSGNQTLSTLNVHNVDIQQGTLTTPNPFAPTGDITLASGATLAAAGGGVPYGLQGCLAAYYYNLPFSPEPEMFDTLAQINDFLRTRTPNLATDSTSAGPTLDFDYTDNTALNGGDQTCRFAGDWHWRRDNFVVYLTGLFLAETAGEYTFATRSDDGSMLFINGELVVSNNYMQGWAADPPSLRGGTITLEAGQHAITVFMYQGGGGQGLSVYMAAPGEPFDWDPYTYTQPALPQALLTTGGISSQWPGLDSAGGNISLVNCGVAEIHAAADAALTGGSLTGTPGTALIKSGAGTQAFALDTVNMQGRIITTEGTLAFDTLGRVGSLDIGEGTTLSTAAKFGDGIPFTSNGLVGKYYNVWPPEPHTAFNELDTFEDYLASRTPALFASSLLAGNVLNFGDNGNNFPPPYNNAEGFQVLWKGRILLAADDEYTFYTTSDDGSMLFINGEAIVRNNAMQGMTERSGTVQLTAGWHDIAIAYYQGGGGYGLRVAIEGGGLTKQNIPNSMLFPLPLDLSGSSWLGAGLTASGTLAGSGTFALVGENTAADLNITDDCTFGGGLAGAASTLLFKTGPATLTLAGDSSAFYGTWCILEGEVHIADGAVLGAPGSEIFVDSGAVLSFDGTAAVLGNIQGSGTLRFSGNGTATLGDLTAFSGAIETSPGQTVALAGGSLDAIRLAGVDSVMLLDGATLYCFDPAEMPRSLISSNGLLVLGVTDSNKHAWSLDRLTVMAGTTQQVMPCASGLFGRYYDLTWSETLYNDVRDALESVETAQAYHDTNHTLTMTVSSGYYGTALFCNDNLHPGHYVPNYENFSILWEGKIRITEPGFYAFATKSDDNSMLFIDGRAVVYSNYGQAPTLRSGIIHLGQGLHDINILFSQGGSGHWMDALIQRPGDADLIPLPNEMLVSTLADTLAFPAIPALPPYTLTASTVAVENAGYGTVEMLMGGTLAFSSLWIDTDAVLAVIGGAKVAGPTLTVTVPTQLLRIPNLVQIGDFSQASGFGLVGPQPVQGTKDARLTYRTNGHLYISQTRGTLMILR